MYRKIARLWDIRRMSANERALLMQALFFVLVIRLGLSVFAFHSVRRLTRRLNRQNTSRLRINGRSAEHVARAVTRASRIVPRATCLTQALAMQAMLGGQGCPSALHLVVRRASGARLEAHALVEAEGRIVLGGSTAEYTTLAIL